MSQIAKPLQRKCAGLFSLVFLVGIVSGGSWRWWSTVSAPAQSTRAEANAAEQIVAEQQIQIPSGTSAQAIGVLLQDAGLIRSLTAWKMWTRWLGFWNRQGGFQAGTYQLSPSDALPEIAQKIWDGEVVQASFTIPEGWSLQQIAAYFDGQGWFTATDFRQALDRVERDRYAWLPADLPILEGFLFPDTYQIPVDQRSPSAVVQIMLNRFEQVALPLYQARSSSADLDVLDWVTLASIVEKEAVVAQERSLIAGVFWNRLRQGIALGADPTVEYGLGVTQTPDQPLTLAQVNTPSPYNTYLNPGLPPTPIASPGAASLQAVLEPAPTEHLYFVARYDGTHVFSRTLREHERAQASIRDQQDAQATTEAP